MSIRSKKYIKNFIIMFLFYKTKPTNTSNVELEAAEKTCDKTMLNILNKAELQENQLTSVIKEQTLKDNNEKQRLIKNQNCDEEEKIYEFGVPGYDETKETYIWTNMKIDGKTNDFISLLKECITEIYEGESKSLMISSDLFIYDDIYDLKEMNTYMYDKIGRKTKKIVKSGKSGKFELLYWQEYVSISDRVYKKIHYNTKGLMEKIKFYNIRGCLLREEIYYSKDKLKCWNKFYIKDGTLKHEKRFDESGIPEIEILYRKNKQKKSQRMFTKKGKLDFEIKYYEDEKIRSHKIYYGNKKVKQEIRMWPNKEKKYVKWFYENKKLEGITEFDEKGHITNKEKYYITGIIKEKWFYDSTGCLIITKEYSPDGKEIYKDQFQYDGFYYKT